MPLAITLLASSAALLPLAAGAAAYAALYPTSQLFGPVLVAPRRPQEFALTFDDGPNPTATPQLLDLLARHNVRATFFLIGENVRREPTLTRRIAAAGHVIGNHTMTHPWLHLKSEARILAELTDCNHALEDTLGTPVALFRPPHGARRPAVLRTAKSLGLTTVNWNLIANDWEPVPAAIILSRIASAHKAICTRGFATNLVLHDGGHTLPRLPTVEAVTGLLASLKNTTFVTPDSWLP